MNIVRYLGMMVLVLHSLNAISAETLKVNKVVGAKEELMFSVLKLVMSKIDPDVTFIQNDQELNTARAIAAVETKQLDVMWGGSTSTYEDKMLPIRIPALKGLLGHRIFIIRAADQDKFNNIQTLEDLKGLKAGLGTLWGDTKIMKAAGLPTVTTIKYPNLFLMLEGGRFDYFPRALHEPWVEVKSRPELNLAIEKHVMLIYPFAQYFYVEKANKALHDKIYKGFEMAIADGSFDKLFFSHPMIKDVLAQANLKQRTVIRIKNTTMHPDTPFDRKEFWLDLDKL